MKKLFSLILAMCLSVALFGITADVLTSIFEESAGYYYCEKTSSLIHISVSDAGLRIAKSSVNVAEKKLYTISFETEKYKSMTESQLNKFAKNFNTQYGKVNSMIYKNDDYVFLSADEKNVINLLCGDADKEIISLLGEYKDRTTRRTFTVYKNGETYSLKISKRGQKDLNQDFVFQTPTYLKGPLYDLRIEGNKISFLPNDKKDRYIPEFQTDSRKCISETKDKTQYENQLTSVTGMYKSDFTLSVDSDSGQANPALLLNGVYNRLYYFDLYEDEYGYKILDYDDGKIMLICNNTDKDYTTNTGCAFLFKGEKLTKENGKEYFKDYPSNWGTFYNYRGPKPLNGLYFENIKASSSLKDKNHAYGPEGMLKVYNPQSRKTMWQKDNLPWAEGKAGDGIGEYVEFDIVARGSYSGMYELIILNGYVDPLRPNLFKENNRIKKALIETDGGFKKVVEFNDVVEFTTVWIDKPSNHVKITIQEVYKGIKYSDTCITAIDLYDYIWEK